MWSGLVSQVGALHNTFPSWTELSGHYYDYDYHLCVIKTLKAWSFLSFLCIVGDIGTFGVP